MINTLLVKVTILLVSFACMADLVIIPAIGGIYSALPDADPVLLDFILTGPMLIAVFSSLLCGILAKKISKKHLLIGAYIIFIIATCGGALFTNIYYIVAMRALVGFAFGIVSVAAMGLIAEVYIEEAERSSMVGLYNGIMAGIGIIMSLISGFLAVDDWKNSFYIYLLGIPILIMIFAYLPKTPPEGKEKSSERAERLPLTQVSTVAIAFFLFNALYCIVCYYIALYLEEIQLGDASTAGILTSVGTIGSLCGSLLFSPIYLRLKSATPITAYFVMGAAYIVLSFPSNIWIVGAMCLLAGMAYGIGLSFYFMHASMIVPPSVISATMAIMAVSVNLGTFFSSYALNIYKAMLHIQTIAPTFLYIGITLVILGVLSMVPILRSNNTSISQ
ncbi:MFS transporter [Sporomusa sp.]|uniref:MFS transporter n=1 Tax=Sporomusa sp. TaxID=2078658 RepID=UPI002D0F042D|nr:MFS transporter [Sporomusa sp.]HWR42104.1 MFS transporter [Sporomusa sp.]